ncbi:tetratricopeptide repeat protein [Nocardiopsis composta]|uniref:Tetratricopeptide (TPR) repeat protein n=1 Tax=Nocardiopsis composta TaxID=157465 RepID=A0A7W8QHM4_9ACTN|nr:tetratricopeptide repeat protein [Nocardiopsis composta]MBB5430415.1 tetratricopeptide (TPR) repeat protein [Nocardiopsis composta]
MTGPAPEWENRLEALWASSDELPEEEFRERMAKLTAEIADEHPGVAHYELGGAEDSTGRPEQAAELYFKAIDAGLQGTRRRRLTVQLASTLRNLGRPQEGHDLLTAELARASDELDDALAACLTLMLVDLGRPKEAAGLALGTLAPHLPRYNRSMANYARIITEEARAAGA